jgi:hypothetical protein
MSVSRHPGGKQRRVFPVILLKKLITDLIGNACLETAWRGNKISFL